MAWFYLGKADEEQYFFPDLNFYKNYSLLEDRRTVHNEHTYAPFFSITNERYIFNIFYIPWPFMESSKLITFTNTYAP